MDIDRTETEKVLKDMVKQIEDILVRDGYITNTKIREIMGFYPYQTMYSDDCGMVLVDSNDILRLEI